MARILIDVNRPQLTATTDEYKALESGDILYFPQTPFELAAEERAFLLGQKQAGGTLHKNISYRPAIDKLKGVEADDPEQFRRTHEIMRNYSQRAVAFTASFLARYASTWKLDFASFRPIEEHGRAAARHARNDLIHVDAFGSRPSHGNRLLRIFTNINPEKPRTWVTSDHFDELVRKHASEAGLPKPPHFWSRVRSKALAAAAGVGIPVVNRPEYDRFMRRFHHYMKDNENFQQNCRKDRWDFPPDSTWIVFTDTASHACLSGRYALEQTFIVDRRGLVFPERSPIAILEKMVGFPLTARSA